jgi:hypothetical protein
VEFILEKQNFRLTQSLWTKHVKDLKWRLVHHTQLRYRTIAPCCEVDGDGGKEEGGGEGEGKTGEGYRPLIFHNTCNRDVAGMVQSEESSARMELQYHVRVVVTGPKWLSFEDFLCMSSFRDDERFVFIIHCACVPRAYLPWSLLCTFNFE